MTDIDVKALKPYGYAPGNYPNICLTCGAEFRGDKRTRTCRLCATIEAQAAEIERLRGALRIIAGEQQCIDNLMGNADIARAALGKDKP